MYVRSTRTYIRTMKNIDIWDLKILSRILLDEGGIFPPSILLTDISSFPNHHLHSLFLTLFIVLCSECHFHNTSRNTLYNSLSCSPTYTEPRDISCSPRNSILPVISILLFAPSHVCKFSMYFHYFSLYFACPSLNIIQFFFQTW